MKSAYVEHVNVTVSDPQATANMLVELFGWKIRWDGDGIYDGRTIHVGSEHSYLALYSKGSPNAAVPDSHSTLTGLNHIGIVVDDLDAAEAKIVAAGFQTFSHGDYEPGKRFYFHDHDRLEIEVISYAK